MPAGRRAIWGRWACAGIALAPFGVGISAPLTIDTAVARVTLPVQSLAERRFGTTIKQQYDFSCGSAALATLLSYHYEDPVAENVVFKAMYEGGNKDVIRKAGFSMLDMKRYLEQRGYRADGFRFSLDVLGTLRVPAIALLDDDGYKHFVVVKGLAPDQVILGDPARGARSMTRDKFMQHWNGIAFVIRNRSDIAARHFSSAEDSDLVALAPIELSLVRSSISAFTLTLPARDEF